MDIICMNCGDLTAEVWVTSGTPRSVPLRRVTGAAALDFAAWGGQKTPTSIQEPVIDEMIAYDYQWII